MPSLPPRMLPKGLAPHLAVTTHGRAVTQRRKDRLSNPKSQGILSKNPVKFVTRAGEVCAYVNPHGQRQDKSDIGDKVHLSELHRYTPKIPLVA